MKLVTIAKVSAGVVLVAAVVAVLAEPASAQGLIGNIVNKDPSKFTLNDITRILVAIIRYALGFAGAIAAIFLVVNGYQYVISAGNPEKIEKAKMGVTWSIGGFILAASSYAIVLLLQTTLQARQKVSESTLGFRGPKTPAPILEQLFLLLVTFAGAVAVLFLIVGGYRYATSQANPELNEKAKKTVLYSIIGLVVVMASYAIFATISNQLGTPKP